MMALEGHHLISILNKKLLYICMGEKANRMPSGAGKREFIMFLWLSFMLYLWHKTGDLARGKGAGKKPPRKAGNRKKV